MALCRACCSHRARCSTSPAAGEVSVGAGEGDTLGIAPWKCSTAIQDPFQRLASPESNWAVLTESSAGCGVPIGGCLQLLRDISSLGTNGAAHRCHPSARIPSFFGVICQSDISPRASRFFAHILLLAKTSWKQSVGWAGRADAKDLLGWISLLCYCWDRQRGQPAASQLRAQLCQSLQANRTWTPGLPRVGRRKYWPSTGQGHPLIPSSYSWLRYFVFF